MDNNMLRMQQEAADRVRQMQERARKFVDSETEATYKQTHPESAAPPPHLPVERPSEQLESENAHKKKNTSFLSGFGQDQEQLFLLMIAILLVKNNAPIELILALLYLAM